MPRLTAFMLFLKLLDAKEEDRKQFEDGEKLLPDLRHYATTTKARREFLQRAGVEAGAEFTARQLYENGFVEWARENAAHLYRQLSLTVKRDFEEKPVELVGRLLAQLGLGLKCRRVGPRGQQVRYYMIDPFTLDRALALATSRKAKLEERARALDPWEEA